MDTTVCWHDRMGSLVDGKYTGCHVCVQCMKPVHGGICCDLEFAEENGGKHLCKTCNGEAIAPPTATTAENSLSTEEETKKEEEDDDKQEKRKA